MTNNSGKLVQQIIDGDTGEVQSQKTISKNQDFVMFFRNNMKLIGELNKQDAKAGALFLFFCEQMDQSNALVCSLETISEINGWAVPTTKRKIKFLKDQGFIDVQKSGNANIYFVNARIAWTSSRAGREYAKFKANVILSAREQDKTPSFEKTKFKTITLKTQSKQQDLPLEDEQPDSQN